MKETANVGTLLAGTVRPRAALFVWLVRDLCTRHVVATRFAAQKHGFTLEKTARMASTSAKMPRGPLSPDQMVNRLDHLLTQPEIVRALHVAV